VAATASIRSTRSAPLAYCRQPPALPVQRSIRCPAFPFGFFPFGIWFANANTLYVGDEGDRVIADAKNDPIAGLEKWTFNSTTGQWMLDYTLQGGLGLGTDYTLGNYFPMASSIAGSHSTWCPSPER
jgi:hypothetical protein